MSKLKITGNLTANTIKVIRVLDDGSESEVEVVSELEILPIRPGESIRARLTLFNVELDVVVNEELI